MRSRRGTGFSWNDTRLISSYQKGIIDDFDTCNFDRVGVNLAGEVGACVRVQLYPIVI